MNIVCFGDSITEANSWSENARWPVLLQQHLNEWNPEAYDVFNMGLSGNTTAQGIERMNGRLLMRVEAGYCLIAFGFNDANCRDWQVKPRVGIDEFEANLIAIGQMIEKAGGKPIYVKCHPAWGKTGKQGDGQSYIKRCANYMTRVEKAANKLKAPLIDIETGMKSRQVVKKHFYTDEVHLTEDGNAIFADIVFEQLKSLLG